VVGGLAATTSTVAFVCGACCTIAFFVPAAALGLAGGTLAWLANAHPVISAIAAAAVAGGWVWVGVHSMRTHTRPTRGMLSIMVFATVMAALAYVLPMVGMPRM
jgi:hypothetical protein